MQYCDRSDATDPIIFDALKLLKYAADGIY